ncbi:MAG: hypothetical protein AAFX87_00870 [Bacteroidota bacterium]
MQISKQLEILLPALKEKLNPLGYEYVQGPPPRFRAVSEELVTWINLELSEMAHQTTVTNFNICHKVVEDVILQLGELPNMSRLDKYTSGKEFFETVVDRENKQAFDTTVKGINNDDDLVEWKNSIITYITDAGLQFVEYYSDLRNVLKKMDDLAKESDMKAWKHILGGGPTFVFRGLIISKLCGDPGFDVKVKFMDENFAPEVPENWAAAYGNIKPMIFDLEKLY